MPAYCRLREDLRTFRTDRILAAELTDVPCPVRQGVSLDRFGGRRDLDA